METIRNHSDWSSRKLEGETSSQEIEINREINNNKKMFLINERKGKGKNKRAES